MAYIKTLFNKNFLEYASYVIKDRAIPHVDDGMKPVQRRILHSLYEMDDGKFNKVANVVGHCMKYHPHGDASIYSALVVLANKDLFIEKQGNFGNILTGDPASAARYIECRLSPLGREVLFNPEITEYLDSYDGRNQEPITFPSKIPVILIQGTEGIAVGMATKILSHNFIEVLEAVKARLHGKRIALYPDFFCGGLVDVSDYADGNGRVLVRAKLDTSDPKKIIIRELPFGSTTESLINSIEAATKKNKLKISSINDFTTDNIEIEIKLARGVKVQDTIDALYAFTDCENSISVNLLVIENEKPVNKTVSMVIEYYAQRIQDILEAELKLEEGQLNNKLHAKTLEQIFVEERIYKQIEEMKSAKAVEKAVIEGFIPFAKKIKREVSSEDVERLLKIPIRRISLYDISKVKKEIREIKSRLKEIKEHLGNLVAYAEGFLENLIDKYEEQFPRRTKITSFKQVDVREAAQRNLKLKYDSKTGYLGTDVSSGNVLFDVSQYDRVLVIRKDGFYSVMDVPDKLFVDKGMWYCGFVDDETVKNVVFTLVYKNNETGAPYIKKCRIEKFILNKAYSIVPEDGTLLQLTTKPEVEIQVDYKVKPRLKVLHESFNSAEYLVKGVKAQGVRLANKEVKSVKFGKRPEDKTLFS